MRTAVWRVEKEYTSSFTIMREELSGRMNESRLCVRVVSELQEEEEGGFLVDLLRMGRAGGG